MHFIYQCTEEKDTQNKSNLIIVSENDNLPTTKKTGFFYLKSEGHELYIINKQTFKKKFILTGSSNMSSIRECTSLPFLFRTSK